MNCFYCKKELKEDEIKTIPVFGKPENICDGCFQTWQWHKKIKDGSQFTNYEERESYKEIIIN